ncbi:Short-chain dehydrogenase/reductase SDR [Planktothrix serta PCC 8927]|uniref:Short-chain dehydrogenase/reductase SDR n=1 Tax=Planktothrix serta PCC 8927 TaxID=671068 RepID=A0A7Z9BPY0_9CYAN|nr:SDR family NAD(P)-dependent oxidoreductase [Planktothrix serta]VXD15798.1 Short-chain dehydrogenase/reductase SDR [Planktothrix serta PCC 8927]
MQKQVCLITGGSSGIGLMTALELAKQGNHVFIACRSQLKANQAIDYIKTQTNQGKVEFLPLDLASLKSIHSCVDLFDQRQLPLNVLINNAGIFNQSGTTKEGFELIWGTNYLGHFLLTYLLLDKLKTSESSQILFIASDLALWSKNLAWKLWVKKTPLNFLKLYADSKVCLLLLMRDLLQNVLSQTSVRVNALHPGFVQSNITIWHRLSRFFKIGNSPQKISLNLIKFLTYPEYCLINGQFLNRNLQPMPLTDLAQNDHLGRQLWEQSLFWTGLSNLSSKAPITYHQEDGIWGPYSLNLTEIEIQEIQNHIFTTVLPHSPSHLIFNSYQFLKKADFGSLMLLLIQGYKRQFNMERHLDSPVVLKLCQNPNLLQKVKEYLGESPLLWRSELWVNYPAQQLIPLWHQDRYPQLLTKTGKTLHVYMALTEVNAGNGFQYLPNKYNSLCPVKMNDPFSGNPFFDVKAEIEKAALPVSLKPGEFIFFTDDLIHRSICNISGQVRLSLTLRLAESTVKVCGSYSSHLQSPILFL